MLTKNNLVLSLLFILLTLSCGSDDDDNENTTQKRTILNLRTTGASANELLSDNQYKELTLELISVKGFEPTKEAVDNLLIFIENRLNKPGGINVIQRSIDAPDTFGESYDIEEIDDIEESNRTQFSTEIKHSIYIFFSDKPNEESNIEEGIIILGTAYRNTSMVIYEKTLQQLTSRLPNALTNVETGVLTHELCHLLGLVNVGTPLQSDHEAFEIDEDGEEVGGHCNVPNCLMQASAPFMQNMMNSVNLLELDPLCIKDLQANGGK